MFGSAGLENDAAGQAQTVALGTALRVALGLKLEVTAHIAPAVATRFRPEFASPVPLLLHPQENPQLTPRVAAELGLQLGRQVGLEVTIRTTARTVPMTVPGAIPKPVLLASVGDPHPAKFSLSGKMALAGCGAVPTASNVPPPAAVPRRLFTKKPCLVSSGRPRLTQRPDRLRLQLVVRV